MRQDARENRERILAAADAVFGARGAAGSTEEVARRAGVGIGTVFRHFPTKEALVEAALLRHLDHLTDRAHALAEGADPAVAWRTLIRDMIAAGATKLALVSALSPGAPFPASAGAAVDRLKAAVDAVLRRAQAAGAVRPTVTVDEVYLLIRALAQASAAIPTDPAILDRAVDVVLTGLSAPASTSSP